MTSPIAMRGPSFNRPERTTRTHTARLNRHVGEPEFDAASLVELGEESLESRGARPRMRRYTSAHMLRHDAQERLDAFALDDALTPTSDPGDVLERAKQVFDDPSDLFAALDVLSTREDLAACAEVFAQAQAQLIEMLPPGWVEAGLNVALLAKQHAAQSGMPATDLRDLYRCFIVACTPVLATFAQWVRDLDERRRAIVIAFICAGLAAEIDIIDPACSQGEGDRRRAMLRELGILAHAEHAFVKALLVAAAVALASEPELPMTLRSSAVYSLIFVGIVEQSVTADGVVDWLMSLGAASTQTRVRLTAALHRETAKLPLECVGNMTFRERLLCDLMNRLGQLIDRAQIERPDLPRSAPV